MFYISLLASKLWYFFTKRFTTSDRCGMVALRLYDNFLNKVSKPKLVIAVTGTNGKTTTCNFLVDSLTACGYKVTSNREGANLRPGIAKALMRGVNIFNKCKVDVAVIEFDELSSKIILPFIKPNYVVVTNLFRDTMKRNGHTEFVFNRINEGLPNYSTLVLNADDLISSRLGKDNKKIFFSIEKQEFEETGKENLSMDIKICPLCHSPLKYDFIRYHQIGNARCLKCGYKNPKPNYTVKKVLKDKIIVNKEEYPLVSPSFYNIYNELCLITLLKEIGVKYSNIRDAISNLKIVETRFRSIKIKDKEIITHMIKGGNSISVSRGFDFVSKLDGNVTMLLLDSDQHETIKDGKHEFVSYMYDTDYELLNNKNIKRIIIAGIRRYDEKVRLLMAGIPEEKLYLTEKELDSTKLIDYENTDKIVILCDIYTNDIVKQILEIIKEDLK